MLHHFLVRPGENSPASFCLSTHPKILLGIALGFLEEAERPMLMWYPESPYRLKGTVFMPDHGIKSACRGMHEFLPWVLTVTSLGELQIVEPKPHAGGSWLAYSWAPEGGKRRATPGKNFPVVHMAVKADNNSPGALWSHCLLEEKHPDHLPSTAHLKGDWGQMRTRSPTFHLETLPAGVQRERRVRRSPSNIKPNLLH